MKKQSKLHEFFIGESVIVVTTMQETVSTDEADMVGQVSFSGIFQDADDHFIYLGEEGSLPESAININNIVHIYVTGSAMEEAIELMNMPTKGDLN